MGELLDEFSFLSFQEDLYNELSEDELKKLYISDSKKLIEQSENFLKQIKV